MLLKSTGSVTSAFKLFNVGDLKGAETALKGLSTESILATTRFMGFGDAEAALAMKLQGCSAEVVAQRLAMSGAGEVTTRTALELANFTDEEVDAAISATTFTAAENASTVATNAFTVSIKNAAKGLWTFLTTNPVGWAILAGTAIFALVKTIDYFNKAQDRAIEKSKEAREAYTNAEADVTSVQSELKGINDQIDAINASGPLSLTDKETLATLEGERQELERQLELKETLAQLKGKEAARAAEEALTTKKSTRDDYYDVIPTASGGKQAISDILPQSKDMLERAEAQQDRLDDLQERRRAFLEDNAITEKNAEWIQAGLDAYDDAIASQSRALSDTLDDLSEERKSLVSDVTGDAIVGYENTVQRIDKILDTAVQHAKAAGDQIAHTAETPLVMSQATRSAYNALQNNQSVPARQRQMEGASSLSDLKTAYQNSLAADQEKLSFTIDIKAESDGLSEVQSALKEAASATGLTDESIAKLESRFSSLQSYDPSSLFIRTANGVKVNTDELTKLEAELANVNNTGVNEKLATLKEQLADVDAQLANTTGLTSAEVAELVSSKQELIGKIQATQQLSAQYAALTSNYQKWLDAQNGPEEGDMYDSLRSGLEKANELFSGGLVGTNEFKEYVDLLSGKDLSTASVSEITAEWQKLNKEITTASGQKIGFKATDFLKDGSTGVGNFLGALKKLELAEQDAEGQWTITAANIKSVADDLGLDDEFVESMFGKLKDYGAEFELQVEDSYGNAVTSVESALKRLKQSGDIGDIEINVETSDMQTAYDNMVAFESVFAKFKNEDGTLTFDADDQELVAAYTVMSALYDNWLKLCNQNSVVMQVDSSGITESSSASDQLLKAMQDLVTQKQELAKDKALGLDTSAAEQGVADATQKITDLYSLLSDDQKAALNITVSEDGLVDVQSLVTEIQNMDAEKLVTLGVSQNRVKEWIDSDDGSEKTVNIAIGSNAVDEYVSQEHDTNANVHKATNSAIDTWLQTAHTVRVNVVPNNPHALGVGGYQGTAHMRGTAYAGGNWGVKQGTYALTGEKGMELVVDSRSGRWYTVGDHGAEFANIPRGAIVFNHKQTEQLLKYGHINSRGQAMFGGSAFAKGGTTVSTTSGFPLPGSTKTDKPTKTDKVVENSVKSAAKSVSDAADSVSDEASKTADWVEKVLANLEKKADKYISRAEKKAEHGNYTGAEKQYRKAEKVYADEMAKQKDAESIYAAQAAKVLKDAVAKGTINQKQASSIENKVAHGSMEVSTLSEGMGKVVSAYEEYYDKAVAAADATSEIYEKYEEVAQKLYQLPLDQASAKTDKLDNEFDLLEKRLEVTNDATKKAAIMEQEMANVRDKHAASMASYEKANNNYIDALRKINESSDKALTGLTESQKQYITEMVAAGEKIDYSSIVGASDEAKRAIIDYNSALATQQQALYDVQMSSMETTLSLRELAAAIANQPLAQAEARQGRRDKEREVREAEYANLDSAHDKNVSLHMDDKGDQKKLADYEATRDKTLKNMENAWSQRVIQQILTAPENNGKVMGDTLKIPKGLPKNSQEYKDILQYNAYAEAYKEADRQYRLVEAKTTTSQRENAATRVSNIVAENDAKIDGMKNDASRMAEGIEAMGDTMEAIAKAATPQEAQQLADKFEQTYGLVIDTTQGYYENLATANEKLSKQYDSIASEEGLAAYRESKAIERESANLTEEEKAELAQGIVDRLIDKAGNEKSSAEASDSAADAAYKGTPEQYNYRRLQEQYAKDQRANDQRTANGYSLTSGDYESILRDIYGYTDAQGTQVVGLLQTANAEVNRLEQKLSDCTPDTPEYEKTAEALKEATDYANGLAQAGADAQQGFDDAEIKDYADQLEVLQNQADALKDKQSLYEAMGIGKSPFVDLQLASNSQQQIAVLEQQRAKLMEIRSTLDPMSEEYRRITHEIQQCDAAIRQAKTDQASWKQEAMNTAVNAVSSVGNSISSIAGSISQAAAKIREILNKMIQRWIDYRTRQLNKIYDRITRIDTKISTIQSQIDTKKELGQSVTAADYVDQAALLADKIKTYETELIPKLESEYRTQKAYRGMTEEGAGPMADPDGSKTRAKYETWQKTVTEYENLQLELTKLLNSGISSALLEPLAESKRYISDIYDILGGVSDLITDDMLYDASGKLSELGGQKMSVMAGQYRAVQQEVAATRNEIAGLTATLISGQKVPESFMADYADKWKELTDAVQSQKQLAIEMVEAMRDASEEELKHLHDIIDARREALQSKKDYYDYDKTIRGKTKDIQALQAQIAALNGLTDAESKAKRARLEAELRDAQEELDDTIQQHQFDLSDKALEDLSDALEKANADNWEQILGSVSELVKYAAEFSAQFSDSDVADSVEQLLREWGAITGTGSNDDITMISSLFRQTLGDVNSGAYNDRAYSEGATGYNNAVDELQQQGLLTNLAKIATSTEELVQAATNRMNAGASASSINTQGNRSLVDQWRAIFAGNSIHGESGGRPNALAELATLPQTVVIDGATWLSTSKIANLFGGAEHLTDVANNAAGKAIDILEKLRDVKIGNWHVFGNYASGTKRVGKDKLAWTQEGHKEEWIVRQSDGAILTPLSNDDGVLPANLTSRLWNLATGAAPTPTMPTYSVPDYKISENFATNVTQNFDALMRVDGNVDATVIDDLKKFTSDLAKNKDLLESAYQYTSNQMYKGYLHSGGKRRL